MQSDIIDKIDVNFYVQVRRGRIPGCRIFEGFGEREGMSNVDNEDIWTGTANLIPYPPAAGVQAEVVSSSVNDTAAGTGIQQIEVHYIKSDGTEAEEDVTLNGTTGVPLAETNLRYCQSIHAKAVGTGLSAAGDITVYLQGDASTVYEIIKAGDSRSLSSDRMIPYGKTLFLTHWHATEAQNRRARIRIRSSDHEGTILPGVFLERSSAYLNKSTTGAIPIYYDVPELSVIKATARADTTGADVSAHWLGILIDD
jgi:hypothetical protein